MTCGQTLALWTKLHSTKGVYFDEGYKLQLFLGPFLSKCQAKRGQIVMCHARKITRPGCSHAPCVIVFIGGYKQVSRINSSVLMTVNHIRNQVIDTYHLRESIVSSLKGLASGDSAGMEFLKNWSVADIKLNRIGHNKSESNTVYLKLMFRSVRDAKKVLKSWTNPRRVKEHHIVASWAAPSYTLRGIFKRTDK